MKISLNWLKYYVDLKGISTKEIVDKLTMSGLEVEDVVDQSAMYENFVVGFVNEKTKHPNADKLSLCKVSIGDEEFQVICGAPNVDAGQKVVFAKIGAIVPKGEFKITKAKIRGIESFGMICSEAELEISDNHDGIMVLPNDLKEGKPISEALNLNDVFLEIAITPNRSDALSHIGVARDLAAIFERELKLPSIQLKKSSQEINELASVEIIDEENCPRYSSCVVTNVKIQESPEWLKKRLTSIGLRPISNIVDVTNYVMYETGQPLHAFDLEKLAGNKIIVQSTEDVSTFTTLDSKERKLPKNTLMICDAEKPVAIAGVMGGENSEISDSTKNILIESAHFNSSSVRRTSKNLGLSTEASYRFERGVDPNNTLFAAERAAQLISELSGGEIADGVIDEYPNEIESKEIGLRFNRIKRILGYDISKEKVLIILNGLGLKINSETEEYVNVSVPTFRPDIEREIDLIEEIARIYGYDNIPTISKINITLGHKVDESNFVNKFRDAAISLGLFEMINNPLQSESLASLIGNKIALQNPQSIDMAYLRTSLIPGALQVISSNIKVGEKNLLLFEIGNVFNKISQNEIKRFEDFEEKKKIIIAVAGKLNEKEWNLDERSFDFYYLKGIINAIISKFSLDNVLNDSYYHNVNTIYDYHYTKNFSLGKGNDKEKPIGIGGKIKKDVLKKFDINQDVYCFEFDLDEFSKIENSSKSFIEPLKYPKIFRDFAFIFDKDISYEEVKIFIKKKGSSLLKSINLFDLFESESLGNSKKSMAFSLEYFDENRTLKEEEVEKDFVNLISLVTKNFNATLRGN